MKFYLAPMEGLTGYIYRNAHATFFGHVDKYFTPFITTNQFGKLSTRELHDIMPEHNEGICVVPQILTNNAEEFIRMSHTLKAFGYDEVNLNLGCPSGTVVSKNRGSGFLAQKEALNQFLETVFSANVTKISIKTRIGKEHPEEFYDLIQIFNAYPMEELIIHPRVQKDYYKNKPRMEIFKEALEVSKNPVCYNGDIFTAEDYKHFSEGYKQVDRLMLGRGLIANPGLVDEIQQGHPLDKQVLKAFHDKLYMDYQGVLSGERNVLFKMKEAWFYMSYMFEDHEKHLKKIRKSQRLADYEKAVASLFEERHLLEGAGLFCSK